MTKYPDDDVPFRTLPDAARLDSPLVELPSGRIVTALPLADGLAPMLGQAFLRASLVRVDAIDALARFGLVLCPLEVLQEMATVGLWTPPVTLVSTVYDQRHMSSLGYKREHDRQVWAHLAKRAVGPATVESLRVPVVNFGKTHSARGDGLPEDEDCWLAGWDKTNDGRADFIQAGTREVHPGQARSLRDYATNAYGVAPV